MNDENILWKPGELCLLRGVNRGNVCCAHSTIVVKDSLQTALLVIPGVECALPAGY